MRIVVLDGFALNPGDLSWAGLQALGTCEIFDRTPPGETVERAADAEMLLTNKTAISREVIERLPKLKYIGVLATGYNVVDINAARERNTPVTNVPEYATTSVAQFVFAHLLNLTQRMGHHAQSVLDGRWADSVDFCYWDYPLVELSGLTMGIVGFGRTGQATARLALAFGMEVIACDAREMPEMAGVRVTDVGALFRESDVISLHCPLTPETQWLVNRERLASMKKTAYVINTSRGPVIDEQALADALNSAEIAGAGLDVLSAEPPSADNPLIVAKNCFITPHIAWATASARGRLLDTVVENARAFIAGRPQNVVNP